VFDLQAHPESSQRDIFAIAIDGSRGGPLVEHPANDAVAGWTPDGHLLFTSNRTESVSLWRVAVANGASKGEPALVRAAFIDEPLGTARTGSLYALSYSPSLQGAFSEMHTGSFDFSTGQFTDKPAPAVHNHVGTNGAPEWSADGSQLAYVSQRAEGTTIVIRSASGEVVRELKPEITLYEASMELIRWSPDGRSFAAQGYDTKNREGVFRIDATSGKVTPFAVAGPDDENVRSASWSPDGSRLYFHRRSKRAPGVDEATRDAIVEFEPESGRQRTVFRGRFWDMYLSPDGRSFAIRRFVVSADRIPGQQVDVVWTVVSMDGGKMTPLMHASGFWAWSPDSRSVWLRHGDQAAHEVWRVPVDGSPAQQVALRLDPAAGRPRVHPDGKRLLFETRTPPKPRDVIVLRNLFR
jgi:Tol biopolymer transport system component